MNKSIPTVNYNTKKSVIVTFNPLIRGFMSLTFFLCLIILPTKAKAVTTNKDAARLQLMKYEKLLERSPNNQVLIQNLKDMVADIEFSDIKEKGIKLGLKHSPGDNFLRLELAETFLEKGQLIEAARELDKLLTTKFKTDQVLIDRALVEEGLENPVEAITYLKQAVIFSPSNYEIWEHLGDNNGWLGRYRKAFTAYDRALKLLNESLASSNPEAPDYNPVVEITRIKKNVNKLKEEELKARSDSSIDTEDMEDDEEDEAEEKIEPLNKRIDLALKKLKKNPLDFYTHLTLGHLFSKKQQYERAIPHFFIAMRSTNERYSALTGAGVAFVAIGELTTGFSSLGKAVSLAPQKWNAWAQTLRSAMSNNRKKLTEIAYRKVKLSDIEKEDMAILMGKYALFHKRYKEAQETFKVVLSEIPEESEAIEGLAMIAMAAKDYDKADKLFLEALTYEKDSVWYLELRGMIAEKRKRPHLAMELYEKALKLRPLELERYKTLGRICNQIGERAKAYDTYSQALRMAPNDGEIISRFLDTLEMGQLTKNHIELSLLLREKLARIQASEGNYVTAVTSLEKLSGQYATVAKEKETALALSTAKTSYTRLEKERLLAGQKNALSNEIRIRKLLAELYTDLDNSKKAKEQYERLLLLSKTDASYILALAKMYNDEGLHKTARNKYSKIPVTELEMREKKKRAQSFDEGGSKTDAVRQYKNLENYEAPDDEVLTYLGNWQSDKGNRFRAEEYYKKAMEQAEGNTEAATLLRRIYLEDKPDLSFEFTSGSDSDDMEWSGISLLYRKMIEKFVITLNAGYFSLEDRLAKSSGPGLELTVASDPLKELQWNLSIGQDPRTVSSGVNYSAGLRWIAQDFACFSLNYHDEGFGETALAAESDICMEGIQFNGELYTSGATKVFFEALSDKLSDGNKRNEFSTGITGRLVVVPGELTYKYSNLKFDFAVPYNIYYSPDSDKGSEFTYSVSTVTSDGIELSGAYTKGNSDGRDDYNRITVGLAAETRINQLLSIEYNKMKADKSIHNGPDDFSEQGLNLSFNILY